MKNLAWLLLASLTWSAAAQTNTVISFTNAAGKLIANAEVVRVFPNKLFYLAASGGGTIRLGDLPPALQRKFGYNPTNAATADTKDEVEEQAHLQAMYDHQLLASQLFQIEMFRHRVFKTCRIVWGGVVKKLPGGLLVDSGEEMVAPAVASEPEFEAHGNSTTTHKTEADEAREPGALCKGQVFLADYPGYDSAVVGDYVQILAYRMGDYDYQAAPGGQKTVRKFTAGFDKAFAALP